MPLFWTIKGGMQQKLGFLMKKKKGNASCENMASHSMQLKEVLNQAHPEPVFNFQM